MASSLTAAAAPPCCCGDGRSSGCGVDAPWPILSLPLPPLMAGLAPPYPRSWRGCPVTRSPLPHTESERIGRGGGVEAESHTRPCRKRKSAPNLLLLLPSQFPRKT